MNTPSYLRPFYFAAGLGLVGLGYLGLILPVMPGTIFFILALGAFRRSSEPLEKWLLANRLIGPTLRDWDARGSIRPRTKAIIQFMLWGSVIGSCYSTWKHIPDRPLAVGLIITLLAVVAAVSLYIATRPSA